MISHDARIFKVVVTLTAAGASFLIGQERQGNNPLHFVTVVVDSFCCNSSLIITGSANILTMAAVLTTAQTAVTAVSLTCVLLSNSCVYLTVYTYAALCQQTKQVVVGFSFPSTINLFNRHQMVLIELCG